MILLVNRKENTQKSELERLVVKISTEKEIEQNIFRSFSTKGGSWRGVFYQGIFFFLRWGYSRNMGLFSLYANGNEQSVQAKDEINYKSKDFECMGVGVGCSLSC